MPSLHARDDGTASHGPNSSNADRLTIASFLAPVVALTSSNCTKMQSMAGRPSRRTATEAVLAVIFGDLDLPKFGSRWDHMEFICWPVEIIDREVDLYTNHARRLQKIDFPGSSQATCRLCGLPIHACPSSFEAFADTGSGDGHSQSVLGEVFRAAQGRQL